MSTRRPTRRRGTAGLGAVARAGVAVSRHPELWRTAAHQVRVLARPRWWLHAPFLPVPTAEYLGFRLVTAYGGDGPAYGGDGPGEPTAEDLVAYLQWCRAYPLVTAGTTRR